MRGIRRVSITNLGLLLAAFFPFFATALQAQAVSSLPQPTDYVSDFAHVLSPGTIAQLDSICSQLDHSKANAQMAIVTVNSLDGEDATDYAYDLEAKWKMGRKGSDRGALVLLAVNDHKYRIEVGYGLEGILNDAKVGDIGRAMVPYLRANDYDSAVSLAVGQVAQVIATDANITLENEPSAPALQPQHHGGALAKIILLIVLLCFFGGFSLLRMLLGFGLFFGGWGGGPWMGSGGGGFGSGGGGSDSGFGGFGGGSFGGGGAGGSW